MPGEGAMRKFATVTRERGVTTIPVDLRESAGVKTDTELTWIELDSDLWLVGPSGRPEEAAPLMASALLTQHSPFPKLMRRLLAGEISLRAERGRRRVRRVEDIPALTEEQMIALGSAPKAARHHRGRQ